MESIKVTTGKYLGSQYHTCAPAKLRFFAARRNSLAKSLHVCVQAFQLESIDKLLQQLAEDSKLVLLEAVPGTRHAHAWFFLADSSAPLLAKSWVVALSVALAAEHLLTPSAHISKGKRGIDVGPWQHPEIATAAAAATAAATPAAAATAAAAAAATSTAAAATAAAAAAATSTAAAAAAATSVADASVPTTSGSLPVPPRKRRQPHGASTSSACDPEAASRDLVAARRAHLRADAEAAQLRSTVAELRLEGGRLRADADRLATAEVALRAQIAAGEAAAASLRIQAAAAQAAAAQEAVEQAEMHLFAREPRPSQHQNDPFPGVWRQIRACLECGPPSSLWTYQQLRAYLKQLLGVPVALKVARAHPSQLALLQAVEQAWTIRMINYAWSGAEPWVDLSPALRHALVMGYKLVVSSATTKKQLEAQLRTRLLCTHSDVNPDDKVQANRASAMVSASFDALKAGR